MPTNSTLTIDFWGVQVEAGNVSTAFQTATGTLQGELAACQRYYVKSYNQDTAPGAVNNLPGIQNYLVPLAVANGKGYLTIRFPVNMRGNPTVTIYSYSGTAGKVWVAGSGDSAAGLGSAANIGQSAFIVYNGSGTSQGSAADDWSFHYIASAEL
jgi:hypothetical protein